MSKAAESRAEEPAVAASVALERLIRSPAALVENLPIGIYTCDRDGMLAQYNRCAAELWGSTPVLGVAESRYGAVVRTLDMNGNPLAPEDLPMAEVIRTARPVRDRELVVERTSGQRLTLLANADPLFDEQGKLSGGVGCIRDIGKLKTMQRRVGEARHVGRYVMEALPIALYTTNAEGKLLFFNKAAAKLWGRRPELGSAYWCGSHKILLANGTPVAHDQCLMAVALREKRALVGPEAIAERPDGTRVPFLPHPTPVFDSEGEMIGGVNMLIDLSEQKRASAQQRSLIDELNHRVKNTLATIQSLAAQTLRVSRDAGDRDFESRLLALSRVHDQLTHRNWEWADFALIANDTLMERSGAADARVCLDGPTVPLNARTALAVAMVLHELAANAERHGALSTAEGRVTLSWNVRSNRLFVDWREEGGPPVTAPTRLGFGARLLERSIAQELGGTPRLEFAPGGVHCTMEIPLPEE